jgi:hypothetical protein
MTTNNAVSSVAARAPKSREPAPNSATRRLRPTGDDDGEDEQDETAEPGGDTDDVTEHDAVCAPDVVDPEPTRGHRKRAGDETAPGSERRPKPGEADGEGDRDRSRERGACEPAPDRRIPRCIDDGDEDEVGDDGRE